MLNKEMIGSITSQLHDALEAIKLESDKENPCFGYIKEKRSDIHSLTNRLDYYLED